jgi:hypothetical protein
MRCAHNPCHPSPLTHTIEYNPTTKWPKCLREREIQYTSIICIHKQRSPTWNQQLAHNLITNFLELYNIHAKTMEHTPIDYKVIFTKQWRTIPKII